MDRRTFMATSVTFGAGALAAGSAGAAATAASASGGAESFALQEMIYVVPATLEKTWHAFTNVEARKIWWGHPTDPTKDALEVRPQRLIRSTINHPGLPGPLQSVVSFAAVRGGTKVTHGYSGAGTGPVWENAMQAVAHGIHELIGDMALYLRTGAGFPRHVVFRSFDFLKGTREIPGGMEVFEAPKGTLAEQLGLQAGDIIVGMAGAGVYTFCDIHLLTRAFPPGSEVEVNWVRGNKLMTGKGKMTGAMPRRAV